jgi:hypothetical protein
MTHRFFRVLLAVTLMISLLSWQKSYSAKAEPKAPPTLAKAQESIRQSKGFFTENKGQWDPEILFIGDTSFGKVAFTKEAIYYQLFKALEETSPNQLISNRDLQNRLEEPEISYQSQVVRLSFVSPLTPKVQGVDILPHYQNYFIGNDKSKWASFCRNYTQVTYQDVWKGIDLAYFFTPDGLKYEFYVKSEADIKSLQIKVEGATVKAEGDELIISAILGDINDKNLKVWDQVTGEKIPARYLIQNNTITYQGIPEKRKNPIVIDPLIYSTYLGGSGRDEATEIAVDSTGSAFVCGRTASTDFPITTGSLGEVYVGGISDIFISKLNANGSNILFSTYIGGSDQERAASIGIWSNGNIYICGHTKSNDFPCSSTSFSSVFAGGNRDSFVTVIKPDPGLPPIDQLFYSSYLGGSDDETLLALALDNNGFAIVCGDAISHDYPTVPGSYHTSHFGGQFDIILSVINPYSSGVSSLVYSTYFGGSLGTDDATGNDSAINIFVDQYNKIHICGRTTSDDFITTPFAFQDQRNGSLDAFVSIFLADVNLPTNDQLLYSTYLGGSLVDDAFGIAVDSSGNIYLTGCTDSSDFPIITATAFQPTTNHTHNSYLVKLNPNLQGTSALIYSTYFYGSTIDPSLTWLWNYGEDIIVSSDNYVFITGGTNCNDFPIISNSALQTAYNGGEYDAFLSKFDLSLSGSSSLIYSTFIGGDDLDYSYGIASDSSGNVYITGYTKSENFYTHPDPGAFQCSYNGGFSDSFVCKFSFGESINQCGPTFTPDPSNHQEVDAGQSDNYTFTITNQSTQTMTYYFIYEATAISNINSVNPPFVILSPGAPSTHTLAFTMPSSTPADTTVHYQFYIQPQAPLGVDICCPKILKEFDIVCVP